MSMPNDYNYMKLDVPSLGTYLCPGQRIRLSRFDTQTWCVRFGWFSFGGNRPMCGWNLTNELGEVKPLLLTDLDDIYMITS